MMRPSIVIFSLILLSACNDDAVPTENKAQLIESGNKVLEKPPAEVKAKVSEGPDDETVTKLVKNKFRDVDTANMNMGCMLEPVFGDVDHLDNMTVTVLRRGEIKDEKFPVEVGINTTCYVATFEGNSQNGVSKNFKMTFKKDDFGDWMVI